ncbi:MAG: helix-hairpin-helix domain-containing protein [Mycoplasmatales bacterium]|nr:helix-hairpin-helix domain-containing protein [Mycoplasmatales bacterium]
MNNSIKNVASQLSITQDQVQKVLDLIKEGSTVPFIARYRKEITGGLDEEQIEKISTIYVYDVELTKRKEAIKKILDESGLLTPEISSKIDEAKTKSKLEAIYEPFKIGKKTKATEAIALGLEPLAKRIFTETDPYFNPYREAREYVNEKVKDEEFAIEQASLIIAQYISTDIKARELVKDQIKRYGSIKTKLKKDGEEKDEMGIFRNYYDSKERVYQIPNHRILAIHRGESLKIINVTLEYSTKKIEYDLSNEFFKIKTTGKIIRNAMLDSLKRLIYPSVEREVRSELFEKAESSAIDLFAENLEQMLLFPAIKNKVILSIDPAFISGCKVAVLSGNGEVLHIGIIFPTKPKKDIPGSTKIINELIDKYSVEIIVIGNGTASRETESFIANLIKNRNDDVKFAVVSETGASVYSASKLAISEFPDLSVEQRSAISIGRRFQDPLNELVKIDPKSIGVGQYQHDVNQKQLSKSLEFKTLKVVNLVGVDANSATKQILSYVSGISASVASNIIEYRNQNGLFESRNDIKNVKGLGPKSFEQSIGFMRLHNSKNPLDKTQIHPESYKLANQIIKDLDVKFDENDIEKIKRANIDEMVEEYNSNKYDIQLILDSLVAPGKDIREEKEGLILRSDLLEFKDLQEGMKIEGTVQNITDFGAFIYIGIKEAALIHISNLSDKFVSHPSEIVKTGERVNIEIILIDNERKRIQAKLIEKM